MSEPMLTIRGGVVDGVVNIRDFGADGSDPEDDSAAIQAAIDADRGPVYIPPGKYYVDTATPIEIRRINVVLFGHGGGWPQTNDTTLEVVGDGPLFRFPADAEDTDGFRLTGIQCHGTDPAQTAVEIWCGSEQFRRDFLLRDCAFYDFGTAIRVRREADEMTRIGNLQLIRCKVMRCNQAVTSILRCGITMLRIRDCEIRRNTPSAEQYVIDCQRLVSGVIEGTCLEGQDRAVRVRTGWNVSIRDCVTEAPGEVAIDCHDVEGLVIENNRVAGDEEQIFRATDCHGVRWFGPSRHFKFTGCSGVQPATTWEIP